MFGDKICGELSDDNVDLSLVKRVKDPTTLAFVKIEKGCDPQYAFFFNQAADRSLTPATLPSLPSDTAALHLSMGAVTVETQPVASAFESLFTQNKGIFASFDPNIRDKMIPNATAYRKLLLSKWLPLFDCVKVSDADLAYLYGTRCDACMHADP
jgi:fructokinase